MELFNKDTYMAQLYPMTISALRALVIDIRAEVSAGLMSRKDAHDKINCISVVLMMKEMDERETTHG